MSNYIDKTADGEDVKKDNPFYHNYVFHESDRRRHSIKWLDRVWLWMWPTYVQITADGFIAEFKNVGGRIFLMSMKEFRL